MDKEDELLFAMNTRLTKVESGQEKVIERLTSIGKNIRVTANDLYRKYFTKPYAGGIHAAFFLDNNGKAVHVAGGLYGKLFMNVSSIEQEKRGHIRNLDELAAMYPDFKLVLRSFQKEED